jgi:hypothetical protein
MLYTTPGHIDACLDFADEPEPEYFQDAQGLWRKSESGRFATDSEIKAWRRRQMLEAV